MSPEGESSSYSPVSSDAKPDFTESWDGLVPGRYTPEELGLDMDPGKIHEGEVALFPWTDSDTFNRMIHIAQHKFRHSEHGRDFDVENYKGRFARARILAPDGFLREHSMFLKQTAQGVVVIYEGSFPRTDVDFARAYPK
jgi:hypothetical protein